MFSPPKKGFGVGWVLLFPPLPPSPSGLDAMDGGDARELPAINDRDLIGAPQIEKRLGKGGKEGGRSLFLRGEMANLRFWGLKKRWWKRGGAAAQPGKGFVSVGGK